MKHFTLTALPFVLIASASLGSPIRAESSVMVSYAILVGTTDASVPRQPRAAQDTSDLLDWNFERDNEELRKLLGLERIETVHHSRARLEQNGGDVATTISVGDSRIEVRMDVEVHRAAPGEDDVEDFVTIAFEIERDGELISAPRVSNLFGERSIVTSRGPGDAESILFLVLQADDTTE